MFPISSISWVFGSSRWWHWFQRPLRDITKTSSTLCCSTTLPCPSSKGLPRSSGSLQITGFSSPTRGLISPPISSSQRLLVARQRASHCAGVIETKMFIQNISFQRAGYGSYASITTARLPHISTPDRMRLLMHFKVLPFSASREQWIWSTFSSSSSASRL